MKRLRFKVNLRNGFIVFFRKFINLKWQRYKNVKFNWNNVENLFVFLFSETFVYTRVGKNNV